MSLILAERIWNHIKAVPHHSAQWMILFFLTTWLLDSAWKFKKKRRYCIILGIWWQDSLSALSCWEPFRTLCKNIRELHLCKGRWKPKTTTVKLRGPILKRDVMKTPVIYLLWIPVIHTYPKGNAIVQLLSNEKFVLDCFVGSKVRHRRLTSPGSALKYGFKGSNCRVRNWKIYPWPFRWTLPKKKWYSFL